MAFLGSIGSAYRAERAVPATRRPRTPLTVRAARLAARVLPRWDALRTAALTVAGFGLVDVGLWELHHVAGLIGGGVSLLILEALSGSDR